MLLIVGTSFKVRGKLDVEIPILWPYIVCIYGLENPQEEFLENTRFLLPWVHPS